MIEHVSSCRREHPQGKYLIKGNPVVIYVLMFVLLLYVFCFDCKCKSLNRLGENINNQQNKQKSFQKNINTEIQDIQPRTRPRMNIISTANRYLSGSGWMSCICCLFVFLEGCLFCVFARVVSLIHAKAQKDNAKTTNTKEKQQK